MDDEPMGEEPIDPEVTEMLRGRYNAPPETPRDEMWAAIQARLEPRTVTVHSLEDARARRRTASWRPLGWAAAAAAVLVLGIGIGRMSAPLPKATAPVASAVAPNAGVQRAATVNHLGRTEALLTLVRADARDGRVDPAMGGWARGLLSQTRLLLDSPNTTDPAMRDLLGDLELVLVQIVRVTEVEGVDQGRARTEMNLALQGLEDRDVLPRIQAVVPAGPGMAGT
jgi:hypothetical protein